MTDAPGNPSPRAGDPPWLVVALRELAAAGSPEAARKRLMAYVAGTRFSLVDAADDASYSAVFVAWSLDQAGVRVPGSSDPRAWLRTARKLALPVRGCIAVVSDPARPGGETLGFVLKAPGAEVELVTIHELRVAVQRVPRARVSFVMPRPSLQRSAPADPPDSAESGGSGGSERSGTRPYRMEVEDLHRSEEAPRYGGRSEGVEDSEGPPRNGGHKSALPDDGWAISGPPEKEGERLRSSEEPPRRRRGGRSQPARRTGPPPRNGGGKASAGDDDVASSGPPDEPPGWARSRPPPPAAAPGDGDGAAAAPPDDVAASAPDDGATAPEPPERYVGTGFAAYARAAEEIPPTRTLAADALYWFWLEISEKELTHSIERERVAFPREHLEEGARLQVVLFSLPGGLVLDPDASTGELVVETGGVRVHRQPGRGGHHPTPLPAELVERRLLFPVRAFAQPGDGTLRCSIYHGQTLVQSRLVRARVTTEPRTEDGALTSTLDYTLSRTLRPGYLDRLPDHCLSLMLNQNADGSHGFFFKGEQEFRSTAAVGELKVQAMIDRARKTMRKVAWGKEEDWTAASPYRYQNPGVDLDRLRDDLLSLAAAGLRLYDGIVNELAEGVDRAKELRKLMRSPGSVQIVNKISPSYILPAALFYDYRKLDTGAPANAVFELCPEFVRALGDPAVPLEDSPCFQGNCPSAGERLRICPSGFWGFRHQLGMPVSIRNAPEAPLTIGMGSAPAFAMAVYRDFSERAVHEQRLQALANGWGWEYADTRDETLDLLEKTHSQIVYFYCHGGMANDAPYLQVGGPGEGIIHRENLDEDLRWAEPRPLVFINGCKTVAVAPEQAFEMVSALVETHNAAGVIGTEITIFEPLATAFAEEFFDRFLVRKRPLGEALRGARLALLKRGNPLGLVYVPFALAGLKLE